MKGSAPGKVILFGEHAAVYNRPALAVPVAQVSVTVEVVDSPRRGVWIQSPAIELLAELNSLPESHPVAYAVRKAFQRLGVSSPPPGLEISIQSTIPVASGLGSGAAVSVALLRALSAYFGSPMADDEVNELAYEVEKLHHGAPSGIDNAVVVYAKPVYFIKGKPLELVRVAKPFTIVIGDTGIPAPTKQTVGEVRRLWNRDPLGVENIFNEIAQIALIGRRSIESGKPELLGELMDQNHEYLRRLAVSSPELDMLIRAAREAGALGAKLSGGGRGGNMIALVNADTAASVAEALRSAGAKRAIIAEIQ
ncbi:MAG: mevalonate kinase [Chloroflexi bacterium]|nr:mevalonate kinase [Chloroflexota bacterium]